MYRHVVLLSLTACLILASAVAPAVGAPALQFEPYAFTGYVNDPYSVDIGWFDTGNVDDLVIGSLFTGSLRTLLGDGDGTFTSVGSYSGLGNLTDVAVGRLGGSYLDDVAYLRNTEGWVTMRVGNGDGTFGIETVAAVGGTLNAIECANLVGSADDERIVAWMGPAPTYAGHLSVFGGTNVTLDVGAYPRAIAVGDFDSDFDDDVAVTNASSDSVSVFRNNGSTLVAWTTLAPGDQPRGILRGEFDGDYAFDDLAVAVYGSSKIVVYLGNAGSFVARQTGLPGRPGEIDGTDFNRDDLMDLVVHLPLDRKLVLLKGLGDGRFENVGTVDVPITPGSLRAFAVGHLDADWKPDIAVADAGNDRITILRNTSAPSYRRLAGADRYETAAAISASACNLGWGPATNVVLATGEDFPDALAGAPLAAALNAPVLLTRRDSLPAKVRDEIQRINPAKVYILGGRPAVSSGVESYIRDSLHYPVERIAGSDRYETAYRIAKKLLGLSPSTTAYVCTGENFPDALSASAPAAVLRAPILLVRSNSVPSATRRLLDETPGITSSVLVGGANVVSNAVKTEFPAPSRVSGNDRYETSAALAQASAGLFESGRLLVATGLNFPDALAGGAVASRARWRGPLLLVPGKTPLPSSTRQYMSIWGPSGFELGVLGGTIVVPNSVVGALQDAS